MAEMEARLDEFKKAGAKLQELADRKLVLSMRRDLRTLAKPVSERVLNALADAMPHGGGLSDRIKSQGRASVLINLKSGVRIQLSNKAGMFMGQFEKGSIRHPVFGVWLPGQKPQTVPANAGMQQFEKEADELGAQVSEKVTETMRRAL
ncbi:MAG: hypothetical protein CVT65_03850 [Actinobacteria bacterium HGW-Actinobacteria-5]|jgi:hypothetical protein|nr:MAG: hypothetical protein CVT65_03850 [Actinobacteria bacterium HGW-Actinobacteria-5]